MARDSVRHWPKRKRTRVCLPPRRWLVHVAIAVARAVALSSWRVRAVIATRSRLDQPPGAWLGEGALAAR